MQKIWIVGLAKDCAHLIRPNLQALQNLFPELNRKFVIIESNSSDNTRTVIENLITQGDDVVSPKVPDFMGSNLEHRTERMARLRNFYLDYLREKASNEDFVAVVDWDIDFQRASLSPICAALNPGKVLSAVSVPRYFDIYAFRFKPDETSYVDLIEDYPNNGSNPFGLYYEALSAKQRRLGKLKKPLEVASAFGGLAIYPAKALLSCRYEGEKNSRPICEHVTLNRQLADEGLKIVIDPGLTVPAPKEHIKLSSLLASAILRVLSVLPSRFASVLFSFTKKLI